MTARKPRRRVSQAHADRVAREAGGLTAAEFARIIRIGQAAALHPRPEAKAACAAIGPLTPTQKKFLIRGLCARDADLWRARGHGDLLAWTIVDGCVGPREALPFDRSDVYYILAHVRDDITALPPKLVVRIVANYARRHGPLDRGLVSNVKAVAKSMSNNIGSGFIDAGKTLLAMIDR